MTRYRVSVAVGAWSATFDEVDTPDDRVELRSAGAHVLAGLSMRWAMSGELFPGPPDPTEAAFQLLIPDKATGPTPRQGDPVEIVVTTTDYVPGGQLQPVAEFLGRLGALEAGPADTGMVYDLEAVDYTADLAEERIGNRKWPDEGFTDRWNRIVHSSRYQLAENPTAPLTPNPSVYQFDPLLWPANVLTSTTAVVGFQPSPGPREPDNATTRDIIDATLADNVGLYCPSPEHAAGFLVVDRNVPLREFWLSPYIGQYMDDDGHLSFRPAWASSRVPDDRGLPYVLGWVDGKINLDHKASLPVRDGAVVHVPADTVERSSVRWRQDKAANPNSVHTSGTNFVVDVVDYVDGTWAVFQTDSFNRGYLELQRNAGVVEAAVTTSAADILGNARAWAVLGTFYDAAPRWTLDELTIRPRDLPGDQWPRLFAFRAPQGYYTGHLGRWVFLHGIADQWSMHPHNAYAGQLLGASLTLQAGRVTMTARLLHRKIGAAGRDGAVLARDLPAGTRASDFAGDVRGVDLALVDHPFGAVDRSIVGDLVTPNV